MAAARAQVGVTIRYDGSYRRLEYPGGDVAPDRGVCSDVVVRAYRQVGIDLQVLVHEDMTRAWSAYPHVWGLRHPDANIDHRRVPNLVTFFRRHGAVLSITADLRGEPAQAELDASPSLRTSSGLKILPSVVDWDGP